MGKTFYFLWCFQAGCGAQGALFAKVQQSDIKLTAHPHLVLRLIVSRAVPPPLCILSQHAQRKPGWSLNMNYTPRFIEDHQLLQKLFRACTRLPDTSQAYCNQQQQQRVINHSRFLLPSWLLVCPSLPWSTCVSSASWNVFIYLLGKAYIGYSQ
jgi:hypothetical protein